MRLCKLIIVTIIISFISNNALISVYANTEPKTLDFVMAADESTLVDVMLYTLFKELGYDISVTSVGMSTGLQMVDSGEMDGLVSQLQTIGINQYEHLIRVPESISSLSVIPIVREDFNEKVTNWNDAKKYTLGYVNTNTYLEDHLYGSKNVIKKNNIDELYKLLSSNEIDIILTELPANTGRYIPSGFKSLDSIYDVPTYIYLNKEYSHIVNKVNTTLSQMKSNGTIDNIINNKQNAEKNEYLILNITSFYPDMVWESELKRGLKSVFADTDKRYVTYTVSLNSKRITSDENRKKSIYDTIRASFISQRPDMIIVSDINALKFTVNNYYTMFKDIPVVFCGVNDISPELLSKMNENFTGIKEQLSANETVSIMLSLFPETQKIYVINDYMEKGLMWKDDISKQLEPFTNRISIEYNDDVPIEQLLSKVGSLPENTLILSGFYFVDKNNVYFSQEEFQTLLAKTTKVPIFGLLSTGHGFGQLGGKYVRGYIQAFSAASVAKDILKGKKVTDYDILNDAGDFNEYIFDYDIMSKHKISEGMLPANATILNKPLPIYKSHPYETLFTIIIAVILGMILFILLFFVTRMRRQNQRLIAMQKDLHTAEELILKDTEIKEIKELLEKIISTAPVFYMFVEGGLITEINDYAKRHIGVKVNDTTENLYANPSVNSEVFRQLRTKPLVELKSEKLIMKDGTVRRFHLNIAKYVIKSKMAFILWGIDVEEIEVQKDIINKSQKELKILIDGLPMAICLINAKSHNVVYVNNSFMGMFKFRNQNEAKKFDVGKLLYDFESLSMEESRIITRDIQFNLSENTLLNAIVVTSLIQYNGETCYVSVFTDIAEEKKRAELLLNAAEKEKEANHLKSRFLVNMSHEIRTPMNAIIGLSQLALMKPQSRENNELFKKINVSSKNLLSIINDILDFSKIEAGKMELVEDEFNLEDIVANSFMIASERIENKRIEMLLNMSPEVNFNLIGDKTRLWQILKNVLDNSAKYTLEGRVVLTVTSTDIKSSDGKAQICFTIEDTGMGMSSEQVKRLFEPFEQFHNNIGSSNTGTGLGMSIIKQLIDLMDGTIEVKSTEGKGTKTKIVIPFKQQNTRQTMQQLLKESLLENSHVLVADDDPYACSIMKNLLEIAGISPVCVSSGAEAIKVAKEHSEKGTPFGIIILDYMLGTDNGIEVAKQINKISTVKSKLLMVSAYSKQLIAKEMKDAGFSDIIEKPFVPTYFIHQLSSSVAYDRTSTAPDYEKYPTARVLLCEDNVLNQEVAIGMLETFGIVPVIANNGQECLEILEQHDFDIILMDILMPIKDGRQATAQIRNSNKHYKDIPIIAMTANVMKDDVKEYFAEGMNGHIGKPLSFEDLGNQLKQFLPMRKKSTTKSLSINNNESLDSESSKKPELPETALLNHLEISRKPEQQKAPKEQEAADEIKAEEGIARFGGKKDRYIKVLLKFAQELEQDIVPFEEAFSEQNINESTVFIHTLKGVSGNLGIERLFTATRDFETTLRAKAPDPILYAQIKEERTRAKNEIKRRFMPEATAEEATGTGTDKELYQITKQMQEAAENSDPLTCEKLLAQLKSKKWSKMDAATIVDLENQLSEYNFHNAKLILDKYN